MRSAALALCLSVSASPAAAASLESQAYESGRFVEPLVPARELDAQLVAEHRRWWGGRDRKVEVEVKQEVKVEQPVSHGFRSMTVKQKRTFLAFLAVGALIGGLAFGPLGLFVGAAVAGGAWYLLDGAEII